MSSKELIFGLHAVMMLLQESPHRVVELYIQQGRQRDEHLQTLIENAYIQGIAIQEVSRNKLDTLLGNKVHQGIVAKCRITTDYSETDIEKLLTKLTVPPFLLVLDGVQDPHNLGACLRSANAAGVHFVIAPHNRAVGLTPAVRKVASGAAEVTPFIQVTNLATTLRFLKERGIWIFGTTDDAELSLYKADLNGPIAIVLGAEGKGLRHLTRELCDYLVAIPMQGLVESLNVSVAAGICLFETVRQRMG